MNNPQRVTSFYKPKTTVYLGNGKYYYNFDVQSSVIKTADMDSPTKVVDKTVYDYVLVKMSQKPTYKACVEAVIRKYVSASQEMDFINTAKRIELGLIAADDAESETKKYKEYLALVDEIKAKVKADFK